MLRNSAADTFYGGFTASKIRRAVIFPADFRRTNIQWRIRRLAAAEGSRWDCKMVLCICHVEIMTGVSAAPGIDN